MNVISVTALQAAHAAAVTPRLDCSLPAIIRLSFPLMEFSGAFPLFPSLRDYDLAYRRRSPPELSVSANWHFGYYRGVSLFIVAAEASKQSRTN